MQITLKNTRLSFPVLFVAEAFGDSKKMEYSGSFLLEPTDPQLKELERVIEAVAAEKWKEKAPAVLKAMKAADKTCIHNGDAKEYDGYAGMKFVTARNEVRPTILDRNKSPLQQSDGKPYSGCYVDVSLDIWAQDNDFGKRVNAKLRGVRFVKDGEAFGAGVSVASPDDFDDLSEGAEDDAADLA